MDKEHHIVEVGGGTAVKDTFHEPQNASYYIGGKKVEEGYSSSSYGEFYGTAYDGQSIGGGLLVIYSDNILVGENGKFASTGKPINGSCWSWKENNQYYRSGGAGGGSGGGSINIFFKDKAEGFEKSKFEVTNGNYSPSGTYNVGSIGTGNYVSLLSSN